MTPPLDLTEDMIVTPGWRVIAREAWSHCVKAAHARKETARLTECRLRFTGGA